jgi:hypothetical protein
MESAVSRYVAQRSCITSQSKFQQLQLQFTLWFFLKESNILNNIFKILFIRVRIYIQVFREKLYYNE